MRDHNSELMIKRQMILADIGHYFVRNYDQQLYDGSMQELVDELDEIEEQINQGKQDATQTV